MSTEPEYVTEWFVTSAVTGKVLSGPFTDYDTAAKESERQRKQSFGGYGRFNIVSRPRWPEDGLVGSL